MSEEQENLKNQLIKAEEKISELEILHQTVVEHSSNMENELEEQNQKINRYLKTMKKFLSPQLYQQITGHNVETSLSYKRKRLTIFFSDIFGFTKITDNVEPEILSHCLNHYLDEMSKIALKYNATIDKFIGDAIMIFFGDPEFIDDVTHAKSCVKMAIEMQKKMPDINDYWKKSGISDKLLIRIGINTGFTTVGNFGTEERMDYTLVGGEVNLASRLESSAKPGEIMIANSTKNLIDDEIDTVPLGEITVKGINRPINVHQVVIKENAEESVSLKSQYIRTDGANFKLESIDFSAEMSNQVDKINILKSLKKAIDIIERD